MWERERKRDEGELIDEKWFKDQPIVIYRPSLDPDPNKLLKYDIYKTIGKLNINLKKSSSYSYILKYLDEMIYLGGFASE